MYEEKRESVTVYQTAAPPVTVNTAAWNKATTLNAVKHSITTTVSNSPTYQIEGSLDGVNWAVVNTREAGALSGLGTSRSWTFPGIYEQLRLVRTAGGATDDVTAVLVSYREV